MKKSYHLLLLIIVVFSGISGIQGQVASGDFQYSISISDSLMAPTRMAIDHNDNLYVTDCYAKKIRKYNSSGILEATLVIPGTPLSTAVNSNNQLFVGDALTGNIYKINANGSSSIFYTGSSFPNGMTFSPDNLLYVSDSKQHKILVINPSGTLVQTIGEGTLVFPTGIAYDQKNNRIIVGEHGAIEDNQQTRVYIYGLDGTLINMMGLYGNGNGKFYRVQGVTSGRCGNIYVCEPFQGNISVFTENGVFITKFSQFGLNQGQLNMPMDIVFDSQERIWISSMNNGRLEVFTINDNLPSASIISGNTTICAGQTADIEIKLTGTAPWSLSYTVNGLNPVAVNGIASSPYHLNVSQAGTYVVSAVSDAQLTGSCFSGSSTISLTDLPTASLLNTTSTICEGQTVSVPVVLTGDGPWEISYTQNGSNPVTISNITSTPYELQLTQAGTYTLSAVSGPVCNGNILPGNAIVNTQPLPTAVMTGSTQTICSGSFANIPISFTGTAPWSFDYTLDGLNATTIVTNNNPYILIVSDPGNYQLSSISDAHCSGNSLTGNVDVNVSPTPVSDFGYLSNNLTVSLFNNSVNATSYRWDFGDQTTSSQANPIHTFSHAGVYTIHLSSWNEDCRAHNFMKTITVSSNTVDTAEVYNSNYGKIGTDLSASLCLEIFPNPSNGLFTVTINNLVNNDIQLEITNITGQIVYQKSYFIDSHFLFNKLHTEKLDLSRLPDGVYTLKLNSGDELRTTQLVLSK